MAHVLLGWEFGGHRGHVVKLLSLARALCSRGHQVSFALQKVDSIRPEDLGGAAVWQAPLSPRLFRSTSLAPATSPVAFGEVLAGLGFDDASLLAALLQAWRSLLEAIGPDVVCGDYAPLLLLAARGRVPTVATGTGFDLPPATLAAFPPLVGGRSAADEEPILASVNAALRRVGIPTLPALPAVFTADETLVATFAELDPYLEHIRRPLCAPGVAGPLPEAIGGGGDEVFIYGTVRLAADAALVEGLALSRLPVRIYVPNLPAPSGDRLRGLGFAVEDAPLAFASIAERSRLLLSHGGQGFVSSGLAAGLPQIVWPTDLEKSLIAAAIARLGVGGIAPPAAIRPRAFADSLRQIYERSDLSDRARAAAPGFRRRLAKPLNLSLIEAIERLA